jgi:hypothetical protein
LHSPQVTFCSYDVLVGCDKKTVKASLGNPKETA